MTVQALKEAVIHLGFSETLDDNDALFRESAERALAELSGLSPKTASFTLYHLPPRPLYEMTGATPATGEKRLTAPAGKSCFLRLAGKGSVTVQTESEEKTYAINTSSGETKALSITLSGKESEIGFSFHGEGGLILLSLAVYGEALPNAPDPVGSSCYDLSSLIADFGALAAPPAEKGGRPLSLRDAAEGYRLESGHLLYLPNNTPAILTLSYRRRLTLPEEGELPLTEEEAQLLPLLCAAYVWLEDDPDKSAFYFARFREGEARLFRGFSTAAPYNDRTGWG